MDEKRELEVFKKNNASMTVKKGDRIMEFSPELSQQICSEMINLGTQLITEASKVTVEYFKTQADMYYAQLNAYIDNQTIKSNERMAILGTIERLTDEFISLSNETDNAEKQKALKQACDSYMKLYIDSLATGGNINPPKKPHLLSDIKKLFSREK